MPTYYPELLAARILYDTDRSGVEADDTDVTGWSKSAKFILATQLGYNNKDPVASQFKLQWRNVTDAGSFADVGSTGEIKWAATSDVLSDGTEVTEANSRCTAVSGMSWQQVGQESVNDNLIPDSGTIDVGDDMYTECQWALDPSDAGNNKEYEFRIWNNTEGAACGTALCTLTTAQLYYPQVLGSCIIGASGTGKLAADDADYDKAEPKQYAIAIQIGYQDQDCEPSAFKLQWRDVTDSGSFADVASTGEVKWGDTLTDGETITSGYERNTAPGGMTWQNGEKNSGDNLLPDSGTLDLASDYYTELWWNIDLSDAQYGHTYEFRLWNITADETAGTPTADIHIHDLMLRVEGFEHGVMSTDGGGIADTIVGTPTVQSTTKRTGTYAAQILEDVTPEEHSFSYDFPTGTEESIRCRFYFRFAAWPTGGNADLVKLNSGHANNPQLYVYNNGSNWVMAGSGTGDDSAALSLDTWYRVDWRTYWLGDYNSSSVYHQFALDGVNVDTNSIGSAVARQDWTSIEFGMSSSDENCEYYYDDIIISNDSIALAYPIGAGEVQGISPNSDGSHNAGTNVIEENGGGDIGVVDAYPELNDVPLSGSTDFIRQVAIGTGNYATVNFADITADSVLAATAYLAYGSQNTTAANAGACIIEDGDAQQSEVHGTPSSPVDYADTGGAWWYKSNRVLEPAGGWDQDEVNGLIARVGYASDVDPYPYWGNLMIQVDLIAQAVEAIAGTSTAIADADAALDRERGILADADGIIDVSALLSTLRGVSGDAEGIASADAVLSRLRGLFATAGAITDVAASLTISVLEALSGSITAIADVEAILERVRGISVASESIIDITGIMDLERGVEAEVAPIVDADAVLSILRAFTVTTGAGTSVDAALSRLRELVSSASGITDVAATLVVMAIELLSGAATSEVDVNATLLSLRGLLGEAVAEAIVSATADRARGISGTTVSEAAISAVADVLRSYEGESVSEAVITAAIDRLRGIEGEAAAESEITAALTVLGGMQIEGVTITEGVISATLARIRSIGGSIGAIASVTATLEILGATTFIAGVIAEANATAAINVLKGFSGEAITEVVIGAVVEVLRPIAGTTTAEAQTSAVIDVLKGFSGEVITEAIIEAVIEVLKGVEVSLAAGISVTGSLDRLFAFQGTSTTEAYITVALSRLRPILATAEAEIDVDAALTVQAQALTLASAIESVGVITGTLDKIRGIRAGITAETDASASMSVARALLGSSVSVAQVQGLAQLLRNIWARSDTVAYIDGVLTVRELSLVTVTLKSGFTTTQTIRSGFATTKTLESGFAQTKTLRSGFPHLDS